MRKAGLKTVWIILVLGAILLAPAGSVPAAAQSPVGGEPGVGGGQEATFRVVRSDLNGVVIEIVAPAPVFQRVPGNAAHQQVEMAGFGRVLTGGAPRLPVKGLMVGVPPGAEISVRVVEMSGELVPGSYRIVAVPSLIADEPALLGGDVSEDGDLSGRWEVVEDAGIYGVDALYPEQPVVLTDVGYIRHQRLARLEVYPLQVNARSGEAVYHRRMVVEVRFDYPDGKVRLEGAAVEEPDSFERMLARTVVNYESARSWRDPAPVAREFVDTGWEASLDPGYRIAVRETGLYELSYAELGAAGLPTGVVTQTLQMYHHDQELAIHVEDQNGDGVFGAGDQILFWGEAVDYPYAKYTADNIYWLTYGQAEGLRMEEKDGTPNGEEVPQYFEETPHFETNNNYWSPMPGDADDVDRWYWQAGFGGWDPLAYTIVVSDVVSTPVSPTIGTLFYGYTDYTDAAGADHHVEIVVNGDKVGDMSWDGIISSTAEFSITNLVSGSNEVRFSFPGDTVAGNGEITLLDWFEIGYDRAYWADGDQLLYRRAEPGPCEFQVAGFSAAGVETYDVSDPYNVARVLGAQEVLSGTTYVLEFGDDLAGAAEYWSGLPSKRMSPESIELDTASDLRSTANGADYIMIAHGDFLTGTQDLAAHYTTVKGWRVEVVDVQDVYDEFSGGVFYPGAIRAFLAYAFANWTPPAPSYVLLAGDGHYDYHRRLGSTNLDMYIPPYMAPVDFYEGERETDNRYVCFGGEQGEDACWPSMYIGRFPVNDTTELGIMVSRSVDYQASPAPGDWRLKTLFVSDDAEEGNNFYWYSDQIADYYLPEAYTAEKVYYKQVPEYDTAAEVRDAIVAAINEGRLLVSYIGHAADYWWAGEKLFRRNEEVALLTNSEVWPIMLPMTCKEGRFAWYRSGLNGLSETLVRAEGKGAVASWGPTGLGVAVGHDYLEKGFFQAVFQDGIRRLGEATYEGKRNLWENTGGPPLRDLMETYGLLGDPALYINALDADVQVAKTVEPSGPLGIGDVLTYTLTFSNTGPDLAYDVVLADIIPPQLAEPAIVYSSSNVLTQQAGITFTWMISDLLPDEGGEIQIRAIVSPTVGPGLVINEVEIDAGNDVTPTNNVVSVTSSIRLQDLLVSKTGPAQVTFSETITYTITWGNQGEIAAGDVRITDTLPAWVEYVDDASGFTLTEPLSGVLVWEVTPALVPSGTQESFVLTGWVMVEPLMSGPLVNQVEIGSDTPEYDPSDDQDEWSTDLLLPDVGVQKTGAAWALYDSTITYTVVYSNSGDGLAAGVVITDILPIGVSYVRDDSGLDHTEPTSGTHVWQVGQVTAGHGDTFYVVVKLGSSSEVSAVVTNTVLIGADSPDADPTNDESEQTTRAVESLSRIYLPLVFKSYSQP